MKEHWHWERHIEKQTKSLEDETPGQVLKTQICPRTRINLECHNN